MAFASSLFQRARDIKNGRRLHAYRYTKAQADATGTITLSEGQRVVKIVSKTDAGATAALVAANPKQVSLTGLNTTASNSDSLSGVVFLEIAVL
jgi:hypothetical protein